MRRVQKKWLTGLAVAAVAVGCGVANAPPQKTSPSTTVSVSAPAPKPLRLTTPRRIEDIDAVLQQHRFSNVLQQRLTGSDASLDVNVRAKRRAMAVPPSSTPRDHKVDWEVLTGSAVHIGSTGGGPFTSQSASTFLIFGVDSLNGDGTLNASGGISSGVLNPSSLATSSDALFVINNLYTAEPTLAGSALSASSVSLGYSYLITDVSGTLVYALSRQGSLYCLTLPTLATCAGAWPYAVGSTVTWSAPFPEYNYSTGAISAVYFGDDAGKLHCVEGSGTANAGHDCWTPAQLATTNPKPIGPVLLQFDSTAGAEIVMVGDDLGRFYRVEDTGVAPVAGTATVAQADICGVTNGCTTNPYAIRGAPACDTTNGNAFVTSNGSIYQFPTTFAANWQVVASKQLFASPNGPIEDSLTVDSTNNELYLTARSTLYKIPFAASGLTGTSFSTPLVNQVTSVPASTPDFAGSGTSGANSSAGTDSFPLGYPFPYYDSLFVETGTATASTGLIEQYGCLAAAQAPPLNNVTTQTYGVMINTGTLIDWQDGNLNFGFGTGGTTPSGGFVQYPAGDPVTGSPAVPAGWACPTGDTTGSACGATTCSAAGCTTSATCPVPANASSATCTGTPGVCGFVCNLNFADCDGNPANGCEVDYETDVNNCGGCSTAPGTQGGSPGLGLVCSTVNITPTCTGGVCGGTCNAGFSTCGGGGNTGCPNAISCGKNPSNGSNGCCTSNCDIGEVCTTAGSCAACVSGNNNSGGCDSTDALPIQCITVSEGSSGTLTCPVAGQVIDAVDFVSYGTPSGTCGNFTVGSCDTVDVETIPKTASSEGIVLNGSGGVATESEYAFVENMCVGQHSCSLSATDYTAQGPLPLRQFGQQCSGNPQKSLYVQVECSCPRCSSNFDCTSPAVCNTTTHTCATPSSNSTCTSNSDCSGATSECDNSQIEDCSGAAPGSCTLTGGKCVQCVDNTPCTGGQKCDVTTHTCTGCAQNSDCSGTTPVCDTTETSSSSYSCVGCLETSDCSVGVCNTSTHTCEGCTSDANCSAPTPHCNTSTNTCVQCTVSSQCSGLTPVCNGSDACVACTLTSQCTGTICDTSGDGNQGACVTCTATNTSLCTTPPANDCSSTNTCVTCTTSGADTCPAGTICDTSADALAGECVTCDSINATACTGTTPLCDDATGTCVACNASGASGSCAAGTVCNSSTGSCVQCVSDANCPTSSPYCNLSTNTCAGCATNANCATSPYGTTCGKPAAGDCGCAAAGNNAACTVNGGTCGAVSSDECGCTTDAQCRLASLPICNTGTGLCESCAAGGGQAADDNLCNARSVATPICNTSTGGCAGCNTNNPTADNATCAILSASTSICDESNGHCIQCTNPNCTADQGNGGVTPICSNGTCVACSTGGGQQADDILCATTATTPICNTSTGACVACDTNNPSADNAACAIYSSSLSICAENGGSVGQCISCTAAHCSNDQNNSGATPVCSNASGGTCEACTNANCDAANTSTPLCNTGATPNACEACNNTNCNTLTAGAAPICSGGANGPSGSCEACTNTNCNAVNTSTPLCNTGATPNACEACNNTNCNTLTAGAAPICSGGANGPSGSCEACTNTNCNAVNTSLPICNTGATPNACEKCSNANCGSLSNTVSLCSGGVNGPTGTCVACSFANCTAQNANKPVCNTSAAPEACEKCSAVGTPQQNDQACAAGNATTPICQGGGSCAGCTPVGANSIQCNALLGGSGHTCNANGSCT